MSKRPFGAHWLAFLGGIPQGAGEQLETAVRTAKGAGCTLFELACAPVNGLTAEETAQAVLAGGLNTVSFCRFFPGDALDKFGDPLGDDKASGLALETFQADVAFIEALRQKGLTVDFMTGPNIYGLGVEYQLSPEEALRRMVAFAHKTGEIAARANLTQTVEYLRPGEDFVIGGVGRMIELLTAINHPSVWWHGDVFHMLERKENPFESIRYGGNFLKYLHAHGTKRVAPGAFYLDDVREATDQVNWRLLGLMLDRRKYNGPIVPEPFGAEIRDQLPVLGEGLPPAIEPGRYYNLAHTTLSHAGLI